MTKSRSVANTANDNSIPGSRIIDGSLTDDEISASASITSNKVSFTQSGNAAIERALDGKFKERISVKDFGAVGDGRTDDTSAIQAAIVASGIGGVSWGNGALDGPRPFINATIGFSRAVYFPAGTYKITAQLGYGYYTKFLGDQAIIYQSNPGEDIFYSTRIYQNEWNGLILVGGKNQIYAQNDIFSGLEGCLIKIRDCEFISSRDYAIKFVKSPNAGGEQGIIKDSRFFNCSQDLFTRFDVCSISDCWLEKDNTQAAPDAAWINTSHLNFTDNSVVPGGLFRPGTFRYFDNYGTLSAQRNRFGSEGGGGLALVYHFGDALVQNTYPYMAGGQVLLRDNNLFATGSSNDLAAIVLKAGIPKMIAIENNYYSSDGPFIRTNLLTSGQSFSEYFTSPTPPQVPPRITIRIKNNTKWAGTITDNPQSTKLLEPYLNADIDFVGRPPERVNYISSVEKLVGVLYQQTSTSGSYSIVDTGLTANSLPNAASYILWVCGNGNEGENTSYRQAYAGILTILSDFSFILSPAQLTKRVILTPLAAPTMNNVPNITVSAVFWDGVAETDEIPFNSTSGKLRIKVGGYVSPGSNQQVRLLKFGDSF